MDDRNSVKSNRRGSFKALRRAARVDDNQEEIVKSLRKLGYSVAITSAVGNGFPDIVVGGRNGNYLMEIKDPAKVPSKRVLTKDQQIFHSEWRGQISVIESTEEAIKLIKGQRNDYTST